MADLRRSPRSGAAAHASGKRRWAQKRGSRAEYLAALALMLKGYRLQAFRYKTPLGEIDLIMRRGDLIIFVEVKARSDIRTAVDAVSGEAVHRIRAASDLWLGRQGDAARLSMRYDIVAVTPWRWPVHLPDAF